MSNICFQNLAIYWKLPIFACAPDREDLRPSFQRPTVCKQAIFFQGPKLWNEIPLSIQNSVNLEEFKVGYKSHVLSLYCPPSTVADSVYHRPHSNSASFSLQKTTHGKWSEPAPITSTNEVESKNYSASYQFKMNLSIYVYIYM